MNYKYVILIYIFSSILYTQENIPFDVSKQFAVPIENNQLLWNDDKSFNKLLIDRSSRNFKNKFTNLDFEELPEDSSYVKSKFIYEFGDYGFDKLSIGLKKHSKDEEFQFKGSKKSFFGQYSEFANAENPPLSLFYKFDYSKNFENNQLYSSIGYFREESQFIFNLPIDIDPSINSEFSDFVSLTIGNSFIKNNYHVDVRLNHLSKYESTQIIQYSLNNRYELERNKISAHIHNGNFLSLKIALDNNHYENERLNTGFSRNVLSFTNANNFIFGNFIYGFDLIEQKIKPNLVYRNIFGTFSIFYELRNQASMVVLDSYDFNHSGKFEGKNFETWQSISATYMFDLNIDLSTTLKYVNAKNIVIPKDLGEVFIPEADRYQFEDDEMMSLQTKFAIPFKYGSFNFNHSYNFYDSLISSNRSHILALDYLYSLSLVKDNLGINGKLSLQFMSKNNSDFSFNYFKNMPEKKNNIDSDDFINISMSTEIAISDVILTIKLQNALNKFNAKEDYSMVTHEFFNPMSSLLTFGIIWEFDD